MKRFYIDSVGCALRNLESVKLATYFKLNGYKQSTNIEDADITAFFSCGVMKDTETITIQKLDNFIQQKKTILFLGCVPAQSPHIKEKYEKFNNVIILPTYDLDKIDNFFSEFRYKFKQTEEQNFIIDRYNLFNSYKNSYLPQKQFSFKSLFNKKQRVYKKAVKKSRLSKKQIPIIAISKGCNQKCSYCSIRLAIGKHKSKPIKDIILEFKALVKAGHEIISLDADDPGCYGQDIGLNYGYLLQTLYKNSNNKHVFLVLDELNPLWFIKYADIIKKYISLDFIKRIVLPIQSFSPRLLQNMNRYSNINKITEEIQNCHKLKSDVTFCTHILYNYKEETLSDFKLTLEKTLENKFDRVRFHLYYDATDADFIRDEDTIKQKKSLINSAFKASRTAYEITE